MQNHFSPVLAGLAVGLLVLVGIVVLVVVLMMRSGARAGPKMPAAQAWQAAATSLQELGLRPLDTETWTGASLYLKVHVRDANVRGWIKHPCPGGMPERFFGTTVELRPGQEGRTDFARFVASAVGAVFGTLPRGATLTVEAPEMPGDTYKADLTTPLSWPDQPSIVARVLLLLDEAVRRPAPEGTQGQLPPAVQAWLAALPSLEALGLRKLDAETCTRDHLYLKLHVRDATVRGWTKQACQGGAFERFLNAEAELEPGEKGRSDLAQFVAAEVREVMASLPRAARLTVKAPEIPGDTYEADLTTPFTSPDQAATVARVLLMLDEVARRPAGEGPHAQLPPAAHAWMAAAQLLTELGLTKLDAECYRAGTLYVKVHVRDGSLRGWTQHPCPGGMVERFLRAKAELRPGEQGRNELARFAASEVGGVLATLPGGACLTIEAPEIPGDTCKADLTTPFSSPEQAATVARVLLMLDEAMRKPMG
jgi:hypothetical protein